MANIGKYLDVRGVVWEPVRIHCRKLDSGDWLVAVTYKPTEKETIDRVPTWKL